MGLDVHLYKCADKAEAARIEALYETECDALYKADANTAYEKARAVAKGLGLDDWGCHPARLGVREPSAQYPSHLFDMGYFRSSYNPRGINQVLRRVGVPDLYDIFGAGDKYELTPDWGASKVRAEQAIEALKAYMASDIGHFNVITVAARPMLGPASPRTPYDALQAFAEERKRAPAFPDGYSSGRGEFWPKGTTIYAAIPGQTVLGEPALHLVCEDNGLDWYLQALEIVLETIDYVLAQPDTDDYYLMWSA